MYGHADDINGGECEIYIRGWAFDGDTPATPISVHVYADGNLFLGSLTADAYRPEIVAGYQGINEYHGFEGRLKTSLTGEHKITVYAIDQANSDIRLLIGEKNETISGCKHNWDSGKVTKAATCTATGEKTYTCSKCNDTKTEIIEKTEHRYVATKVVAPTTHSKGYTMYKCSVCGDSYEGDYVDPLPDTGNPGSQETDPQEPEQSGSSTAPQEPTQPGSSTTPQEPTQPGGSTAPQEPTQPGTSMTPQTPTQPGTSTTPQEQPGTGTDSQEPEQPGAGTDPQEPEQSGTGTTPQTSAQELDNSASNVEPRADQALSVGTVIKSVAGGNYKVTGKNTVEFTKPSGKKKSVNIPDTITVGWDTYQVTAIAANAFNGNKKLTSVTIGKNIRKIGANAFRGCKNLKQIYVDTKKLKKSRVGKKAFAGINKKAVFKISSVKVNSYKKIFKSKGAPSTAKYKFWIYF